MLMVFQEWMQFRAQMLAEELGRGLKPWGGAFGTELSAATAEKGVITDIEFVFCD